MNGAGKYAVVAGLLPAAVPLMAATAHAAGGLPVRAGVSGLINAVFVVGIAWLVFRVVRRRRGETGGAGREPVDLPDRQPPALPYEAEPDDVDAGLACIRQADPGFDEGRFCDGAREVFFSVQGGLLERDLSPVAVLMTGEMLRVLREDMERMRREGRTSRLESITVRNVDIVEAWQESGQDYVTALIYANLLDYTTDDATDAVVDGSRTVPVKFEGLWTFIRPSGDNPWRLSAIDQR